MLFGRRVGFSGTPSDLLPKEMGQCDYEEGDDGKMMSTILNTAIFDVEHLEGQWTIEGLLDMVANHSPEFHALIDTGALITGYSNEEASMPKLKSHGSASITIETYKTMSCMVLVGCTATVEARFGGF